MKTDPERLKSELDASIRLGTYGLYVRRAAVESDLWNYGESVQWDRELVIQKCLQGPSGWLGREVFEQSFDDGSMQYMAKAYSEFLSEVEEIATDRFNAFFSMDDDDA